MSKNTILIVGGAGFIGSNINKMLDDRGHKTIVLDNLSTGDAKSVTRGKFIHGDLGDATLLDRLFSENRIDAVMHFAACIDIGESVANPYKYYHNNVSNTLTLLYAMQKHDIGRFIFSSSAGIFGLSTKAPITEEHPKFPINPYGATKLMVERMLADFEAAYGLRSCCLRYFNAAGGDPDGEVKNFKAQESNLIPIILRSIKKGTPITIYGEDYPTPDGTCIRDYVHVYDLGEAHIKALEQLLAGGPASQYNLGNGSGFSIKEVIHAIERVTGFNLNIKVGPRRPGDPPTLVASAAKAHQELGWKPRYPELETMIEHAWKALS